MRARFLAFDIELYPCLLLYQLIDSFLVQCRATVCGNNLRRERRNTR